MTTLDPAQVLEDAADVLLVNGRCRNIGHSPGTGEFCVLGAIAKAIEPGWFDRSPACYWGLTDDGVGRVAVEAVARRTPWPLLDPGIAVYDWNDDPATTDDEVRDTLLLAAKDLRNGVAA